MTRILLLMDHKENRRLLAEWLATRYTVLPADSDQAVDESYDLGILDGAALERLADRIETRKKVEDPVFLPFLLVTAEQHAGTATRHLWKSIDEVIHSPIDKVELQARMEVLLRARRQAVDLHDAARRRTDELVSELSEANRRKDEFLAILAHELRNPLAPIRNGLQIMRLASDNKAAAEQARTMMEEQLAQMVRLIDDLLDISRITRGKIELRKERVELAAVIQSAVESSSPLIEASGHDLTVTLPREPIFLDADLTRLAQVFSNLLNNAAKYTDRGGRIRLTALGQGSDVVITVRDTGIGIPAGMLSKVFEMFMQVDRSLERTQGGLGIGLTLVKRLVDMHGGTSEARSDGPGKGSEFVVRLPVMVLPPAQNPQRSNGCCDQAVAASGRRVLVVDDNPELARSFDMLLRLMGHESRVAYDGLAAVEAAEAFRPDVVLMDIGMPKLNGYEAARRIREQPWGKDMALVAVTGWGQEEDRRRSHEAGFDQHLVKPVDHADLQKVLDQRCPASA